MDQTTFFRNKILDEKRKVDIEIGDSKQSDFYPQFKTMHWDNECNFSLRLIDDIPNRGKYKDKNGVIEWKRGKRTARFYEIGGFEDGGFEFDVILDEKPSSNIVSFSIQSKGLDFFYQGELTIGESKRNAKRPENVIGSYAVYHKTKTGNYSDKQYRTGKAFHIYRPEIYDANGTKVYGDLFINDNILTITIPKTFLDSAVYPVTVDPTFGYTSAGATASTYISNNEFEGSIFTAPSDVSTASKITFYGAHETSSSNIKGIIVLNSTKNLVTNGVGGAVSGNTTAQWLDSTFATPPTLSASTDYVLGIIYQTDYWDIHYDSGTTNQGVQDSTNSYTTPANLGSIVSDNQKRSIYVTYTAAAVAQQNYLTLLGCGS